MPYDTLAYAVQPGDNIDRIVAKYYGSLSQQRKRDIKTHIAETNPHILDVKHLRAGQMMVLTTPRAYCPAPKGFPHNLATGNYMDSQTWFNNLNHEWQGMGAEERALLYKASPLFIGSGMALLSMIDTTFKTNTSLVADVANLYNDYSAGNMTKGQYDHQRRLRLQQLSANLGPTQPLLFGDRRPGEVIRINRQAGVAPTADIDQQVSRMTRVAKGASRGGVALSVVGLGIACHEIANAPTRDRQNQILVESGGGLMAGVAFGLVAGLTLVMVATPVGWAGALAIGVGGAAFGYSAGVASRHLYDRRGSKVDFVEKLGVDKVCA